MDDDKQIALAQRVATTVTKEQKELLIPWLEQLLEIRHSNLTPMAKGIKALNVTAKAKVLLPTLKLIAQEAGLASLDGEKIKFNNPQTILASIGNLWGQQSLPAKLGIGAGAVASTLFGSQGAGIAALGTAIGVPLWMVFGAGGAFAGVVLEQFGRSVPIPQDLASRQNIVKDATNLFSESVARLRGRRT